MMMFHDKSAKDLQHVHSMNSIQRIRMDDSENNLHTNMIKHDLRGNSSVVQATFVLIK